MSSANDAQFDGPSALLAVWRAGLVGQPCWGVIAGAGTGSHFSLRLGEKIPLRRPLRNPSLSEDERRFDGRFRVFVQHCAWRLERGAEVLCASTSDNADGGEMLSGLAALRGAVVERCDVAAPAQDLTIGFSGGLVLRVFCDQIERDNWSAGADGSPVVTAGAGGRLVVEA